MANGTDVGDVNRKLIQDQKYSDLIPIASKLLKQYPGKIAVPVDVALDKDGERFEVKKALAKARLMSDE